MMTIVVLGVIMVFIQIVKPKEKIKMFFFIKYYFYGNLYNWFFYLNFDKIVFILVTSINICNKDVSPKKSHNGKI